MFASSTMHSPRVTSGGHHDRQCNYYLQRVARVMATSLANAESIILLSKKKGEKVISKILSSTLQPQPITATQLQEERDF